MLFYNWKLQGFLTLDRNLLSLYMLKSQQHSKLLIYSCFNIAWKCREVRFIQRLPACNKQFNREQWDVRFLIVSWSNSRDCGGSTSQLPKRNVFCFGSFFCLFFYLHYMTIYHKYNSAGMFWLNSAIFALSLYLKMPYSNRSGGSYYLVKTTTLYCRLTGL